MKRKLTVLIIMLFVVLLAACNDNNEENNEAEERVTPVEITEAIVDDFTVEKSVYGRIEPKDITPVMVPMPGEMTELDVENGDMVEEDDLIAKVTTQAGVENITAPASGEILELEAKESSLLDESEPLALIFDSDELTISFSVTHAVRTLFEDANDLDVEIDGETYDVNISSIDKMPDDTGLYPVKSTVENKDDALLPGMVALISLPESRVKDTVIVPTAAIVEESEGAFVYKVADDQVQKVDVTITETQTDVTAIAGKISEGDDVVINGQLTLSDESQVVIVEEENES